MGCCCNLTEQHDSREARIAALRRTIDEARRELSELEQKQEEAA